MIKQMLRRAVTLLPKPVERSITRTYWRAKSDFVYRRLYRTLELEHVLGSGVRLKVASRGEWWAYNEIFVNREYDLPIEKAFEVRSRERDFTVLDLGANVGYFVLRVLDIMRRKSLPGLSLEITAIEGSPETFLELQRRLSNQELSPAIVRAINGLAGRRAGTAVIRQSALHVKNSIMDSAELGGTAVDFVDLAKLFEGGAEIDLLKCDIEGAELLFIENYGDLLERVRTAVFELHHQKCDTSRCIRLLESAGFQRRILREAGETSICFFLRDPE